MDSSEPSWAEANKPFASLDLSEIEFPSDSLSIRKMRAVHAELFDLGFGVQDKPQPRFFIAAEESGHAAETVGGMIYWERNIAVCAYATALGINAPGTGLNLEEMKKEL